MVKAIPPDLPDPTAVILVKYETVSEKLDLQSLRPYAKPNGVISPVVTDAGKIDVLKRKMKDMFVYGTELDQQHIEGLQYIMGRYWSPSILKQFSSQSASVTHGTSVSFSRCADTNYPFQIEYFRNAGATPNMPNKCSAPLELKYPHPISGALQHTARFMLLNCVYSLSQCKVDPSILEGDLMTVAAKLLGISRSTVYKVKTEALAGVLLTPGKTRKVCKKIMIDSFDRETIRRLVSKSYANNTVPFTRNVRTEFLKYKTHEWEVQKRRHEQDPTRYSAPGEPFTCSERSFRKILRLLNFKFGRIDNRAVIPRRPDIVNLRSKFLHSLRKNAAQPTPN